MRYEDAAIILSHGLFSEKQHCVRVLTHQHGRRAGLYRVAQGKNAAQMHLNQGDHMVMIHHARLEEHLGTLKLERTHPPIAPRLFDAPQKLWILQGLCWFMELLPEGHPYPTLYENLSLMLVNLPHMTLKESFMGFSLFEKMFLAEMGFAIDHSQCCVSFTTHNLCYISPKTARAVTYDKGRDYHDRLLPLPAFWLESHDEEIDQGVLWQDIDKSLRTTGYFLNKHLMGKSLGPFRDKIHHYTKHCAL